MASTPTEFLAELRSHCLGMGQLHRRASQSYAKRSTILTLFNMFSTVAIFFVASNENSQEFLRAVLAGYWTIPKVEAEDQRDIIDLAELAIGGFSILTVSTTAVQFLLKYDERNLVHKYVASDYENLTRKISRYMLKSSVSDDDLHRMNKQINTLARHSPPVSSRFDVPSLPRLATLRNFLARFSDKPPSKS